MYVCMYVCTCVLCCCACLCYVCKGLEAHDMMQHFLHVIQEIFDYLRFLVCMCLRYFMYVRVYARACVCVFRRVLLVLCLPVCVAEA